MRWGDLGIDRLATDNRKASPSFMGPVHVSVCLLCRFVRQNFLQRSWQIDVLTPFRGKSVIPRSSRTK